MKTVEKWNGGVCPICGREYVGHPALSRTDNETLICPECGQRQALASIGVVDVAEQDRIIGISHKGDKNENI